MKPHRVISVMCLSLAVGGCTMIPQYERPDATVAPAFPGASAANTGVPAVEIRWREFFAEDRLKELVGLALANNLDLRVAALRVEQSQAQYRIARSAFFPSLFGSGSFSRSRALDRTSESWSASLGSTAYEVDLFGRVRSLNRQALEKFFATEEGRRGVQLSLVAEVASQYFGLRQAEEQVALAQQTLATVEEAFRLNQATFDAGASTELDLRTAEGQVQTARVNLLTFERQAAQAQNALVLLIGRPVPEELPAPRPFGETNVVMDVPPGLPSELVLRRPDILEAEHSLKAANANIGAARAAFFPSLKLTGSIGTTSSDFEKLFGSGTGVWSFSPQVTIPIFTGGQNRADLDAAKVGAQIEVATYQKAIQTAFREVADALVARATFAEELGARAALIEAQEKRFELANARYRQGEDNYLTVLSAQQDLYSARQGRIQAQYQKLNSQISLYRALGGGWQ